MSEYAGLVRDRLQDRAGNALRGAVLLVRVAGTTAPATLYNKPVAIASAGAGDTLVNHASQGLSAASGLLQPGLDAEGNFTFYADTDAELDLVMIWQSTTVGPWRVRPVAVAGAEGVTEAQLAELEAAMSALPYIDQTTNQTKGGILTLLDKLRLKAGPPHVDLEAWVPSNTRADANVDTWFQLALTAAEGGKLLITNRTRVLAANGVVVAGSAVITSATANFTARDVGAVVTGSGIPGSPTILTVDSATQATLSAVNSGATTTSAFTITAGYRLATQMNIPGRTEVVAEDGAVIYLTTPSSAGQTFIFRAAGDYVTFRNLVVDGSLLIGNITHPTGNRYIFVAFGTSKNAPRRKPKVIDCRIENFTQSDGLGIGSSLIVWHGVYFQYTKNARVEHLEVQTSGHGCYLSGTHKTTTVGGTFDTGWGGIGLHSDNTDCKSYAPHFERSGYWSAGYDDMSQSSPPAPQNDGLLVQGATFSGAYGYTSALRISGRNVVVDGCDFKQCLVSGASNPAYLNNNLVVIHTRSITANAFTATATNGSPILTNVTPITNKWATTGVVTNFPTVGSATPVLEVNVAAGTMTLAANATLSTGSSFGFGAFQYPPKNITVKNCIARAGGIGQRFVEVAGRDSFGTGDVPAPLTKIKVDDNILESIDATNYFSMLLYLNSQDAGILDCTFDGNIGSVHPETTAAPGTSSPVAGAIGVVGSATAGAVLRARENIIRYFDIGTGPPTTDLQQAFYLHAYSTGSEIQGNTIIGFWDGILSTINAGENYGLWDNIILSPVRPSSTGVRLDGGSTVAPKKLGSLLTATIRDLAGTGPLITLGPLTLVVTPGSTSQTAMTWRGLNSQAGDIVAVEATIANVTAKTWRINGNGHVINKKTTVPVPGEFLASEGNWTWDATATGAGPIFSGRDSLSAHVTVDLSRRPAIANPTGGATVDAEVRAVVIAILDAMRSTGQMNS